MLDPLLENIVSEKGGGAGCGMADSCTVRSAESEEQHRHLVAEKQHAELQYCEWQLPALLV